MALPKGNKIVHRKRRYERVRRWRQCDRKVYFGSKTEAVERIKFITAGGGPLLSSYECYYCRGFHLTSKSYDNKYRVT